MQAPHFLCRIELSNHYKNHDERLYTYALSLNAVSCYCCIMAQSHCRPEYDNYMDQWRVIATC